MFSWSITVVVLARVALQALALYPGSCPNFTPQADFDPERMTGKWYGVYAAKHGLPLENVKCVQNNYLYSSEDGSLTVYLTQTNTADNTTTTIYVPSEPIDGVSNHAIIKGEMGQGPFQQIFTILHTDYDNKVVTVICAQNGNSYGYGVQVYSREPTLSSEDLEEVAAVLQRESIPQDLAPITQDCNTETENDDANIEGTEEDRFLCKLIALAAAGFFVGK